MSVLLADELDALAEALRSQHARVIEQLQKPWSEFIGKLENEVRSQDQLMRDALEAGERRIQAEKLRLDALWWSEALYSSSIRRSYREMETVLAAVVMAVDLLAHVPSPSPASVGYLLAEAVNRLPNAGFERKRGVRGLLVELRELRARLPKDWTSVLEPAPAEGRLTLRDIVVQSLNERDCDVDAALLRAGLTPDISFSLPVLAHAFFRQEQAVRLARSTT
jgi:hypothetical protein